MGLTVGARCTFGTGSGYSTTGAKEFTQIVTSDLARIASIVAIRDLLLVAYRTDRRSP